MAQAERRSSRTARVGASAPGETYNDLAYGFGIGTSTVYRYIREALRLLAAMAPILAQAIEVARRKAFVIVNGTLLRIHRVGMSRGSRPVGTGPTTAASTRPTA